MTVHRTYSCDLCHSREKPIGKADIFGIYFTAMDGIEIRGSRTVEHHLCRACIEAIQGLKIPQDIY